MEICGFVYILTFIWSSLIFNYLYKWIKFPQNTISNISSIKIIVFLSSYFQIKRNLQKSVRNENVLEENLNYFQLN